MYPSVFKYLAPATKAEALDILAERGDEVKILAGGQSLIPMMKLRLANPTTLLDINGLPDMGGIAAVNGHIQVQTLARHNDVIASEVVTAESHLMASTAPWVADPLVRNRGTVCGSVAHHDPEGDWASVMLATKASVVVESRDGGERTVMISDFLVDMFTTACQPTEMITALLVPRYTRGGGNYQKLERKIGDYATVGVATHIELGDDGAISNAGIALTSVYAQNLAVIEAEELLVGNEPSIELFAEAAQVAKSACDPHSDVRGSSEYKRDIVRIFTERGLAKSAGL